MKNRKQYTKDFKAKVAIEAIKGEKTIQELSEIYKIHPNMITGWKKVLVESAPDLFTRKILKDKPSETELKIENLYNQIGQLTVEKEFLKKKYKQIYGTEAPL